MKPHGISADCHYEIIDNDKTILQKVIKSKLEGYITFENLKTGKVKRIPFRSFVDNFIQTIHGHLSGDAGADTRIQTASVEAQTTGASHGLIFGVGDSVPNIADTGLGSSLAHASLSYGTHVFNAPSTSGNDLMFSLSRILANNKSSTVYPTEVGLITRLATTASTAGGSTATKRMIAHDVVNVTLPADDSLRVTFTFEASQIAGDGGIVLNFVKLIYNILIRGNLNHSLSKIISRTGTTPTYIIGDTGASLTSVAATLGELCVNNQGVTVATGYIGIVLVPYYISDDPLDPISPSTYACTPDHTGFTPTANTISAIEYSSITNGAQFTISRTLLNSSTVTKVIGRVALLTRGDVSNTGASLHADQVLLMINNLDPMPAVAPGQSIKITYKLGIQV